MTKLPVVLAHGYCGFSRLGGASYFHGVESVLRHLGVTEIFATTVDPKGSLRARTGQFVHSITSQFPGRKVHVIAHSMGGLDARFAVSSKGLGRGDLIQTLTTLGTPFQGTTIGDLAALNFNAASTLPRDLLVRVAGELLAMSPRLLLAVGVADAQFRFGVAGMLEVASAAARGDFSGLGTYLRAMLTLSDEGVKELTREKCRRIFDVDQSDVAGLPMFCYAGEVEWPAIAPALVLTQLILKAAEGPNDGLVAVDSATLKRTHMSNIPTDHLGLVGWSPLDVSGWYGKILDTIRTHEG